MDDDDGGGTMNITDNNANYMFVNHNESHHTWTDQDEEWLNNQSADLREQILSDRAAARWRRRSEGIFGALTSLTDPLIVDNDDQLLLLDDDDALDFHNNPAPLSASAAAEASPLVDFDWDTPAILRQEPIFEPSQSPQQQVELQMQMQQEQQPQPEPETQLSLDHNASQAMNTASTALMSDDLNLCQKILGPDCDLCKVDDMPKYDFLQQQQQQQEQY